MAVTSGPWFICCMVTSVAMVAIFLIHSSKAETSTLSLHDALPILNHRHRGEKPHRRHRRGGDPRSEEHTSELQSRVDLVCRLLLEKKKSAQIRVHPRPVLRS